MTGARLAFHQFRYDQKSFWRNPAAVGFTVALPVLFLLIFATIFGNETTLVDGREVRVATYQVPGIITLALVSATYVNLTISITGLRERRILKRLRSTPLPAWAFFASRVGTAIVVTFLLAGLLLLIGRLLYGVTINVATLPGAVIALLLGAASMCTLGLATTAAIPSEEAAPPIANLIVLPLYFISGIFIPSESLPSWMVHVADVLPVKSLFDALLTAFDPTAGFPGIAWGHLAKVVAWGVGGLVVALLTFRWTPRGD
jgi:ABC-2 type transport system permease protein